MNKFEMKVNEIILLFKLLLFGHYWAINNSLKLNDYKLYSTLFHIYNPKATIFITQSFT